MRAKILPSADSQIKYFSVALIVLLQQTPLHLFVQNNKIKAVTQIIYFNDKTKNKNTLSCDLFLLGANSFQLSPTARTSKNSAFYDDNIEWGAYIFQTEENKNVCFSVENRGLQDLMKKAFYFGYPLTINTNIAGEVTAAKISTGFDEISDKEGEVCVDFTDKADFVGIVSIGNNTSVSPIWAGSSFFRRVKGNELVTPTINVINGNNISCPQIYLSVGAKFIIGCEVLV